jgi:hypothetical protein
MKKHKKFQGVCACDFGERKLCGPCEEKSTSVLRFLRSAQNSIKSSPLWANVEEDELKLAYIQIERAIMNVLYEYTFPLIKEDIDLQNEIKSTMTLDFEAFEIPLKYQNEAPWPFASAGIVKFYHNSYYYKQFKRSAHSRVPTTSF